jgi:hypothetical protein
MKDDLTDAEVRSARRRHIFTITRETERGFRVSCYRLRRDDGAPALLSESRECVRPRTARRYATQLVREALRAA